MNTIVSLIVIKCEGEGSNARVYGERLLDKTYPTLEEATESGKFMCGKGLCVIVRPNYNETDSKGRFFREWRSFNGEALKECRWDALIPPAEPACYMCGKKNHIKKVNRYSYSCSRCRRNLGKLRMQWCHVRRQPLNRHFDLA